MSHNDFIALLQWPTAYLALTSPCLIVEYTSGINCPVFHGYLVISWVVWVIVSHISPNESYDSQVMLSPLVLTLPPHLCGYIGYLVCEEKRKRGTDESQWVIWVILSNISHTVSYESYWVIWVILCHMIHTDSWVIMSYTQSYDS